MGSIYEYQGNEVIYLEVPGVSGYRIVNVHNGRVLETRSGESPFPTVRQQTLEECVAVIDGIKG